MNPFSIGKLPRIVFGDGVRHQLPALARAYGNKVLLVTGASSFKNALLGQELLSDLQLAGLTCLTHEVAGEPSPTMVDDAVRAFGRDAIEVVVGIGGGSALDAAKAIAGLLKPGNSVMDHLEGVGPESPYCGPSVPFIAVPTTAGTGSEATKNAVLSVSGADGFKKSFRDDKLVAEIALVDPEFLASCPASVIAANGMDALTQLMESYVSTKANALTDALALDGMQAVREGLLTLHANPANALARRQMAYAALLSGITLAQTGLGAVHGLASPLGAFFPIPHGVVCGTLVAETTRVNLVALRSREPANPALEKYARVGQVLGERSGTNLADAHDLLLTTLESWTHALALPKLGRYGVTIGDVGRIVVNSRGSSMKTNPVVLHDSEIAAIVVNRL